ncbi:hypothetical protein N7527_007605 [Penicillium freii]|nr:hypothetical protein N7527_007605 [Penicillium freii]
MSRASSDLPQNQPMTGGSSKHPPKDPTYLSRVSSDLSQNQPMTGGSLKHPPTDPTSTPSMDQSTGCKHRRSSHALRPPKPREDEMELGVPAKPYEWEREATRGAITKPIPSKPHGRSLPLWEQPLKVPLRELSGWNSASKIGSQYGHFLTTRILWKHSQVEDLAYMNTAVCEALDLPNWAKATAQEYLSGYGDWSRYIDHIAKYPIAKPENPILIGAFSSIRDQQSRIEGACKTHQHVSPGQLMTSGTPNASPSQRMTSGTTTPFTAENLERITRRLQNLTLESRETDNTGGFTALVTSIGVKQPFGNSEAKRRTHEAKINMSFVNLLYTICLLLPTELKWDSIQHHLNLHVGEAEYTAIVDGGLVDPDGKMQVLLEVKAMHLSANSVKEALMQQGLEMLAWITTTLGIQGSKGPRVQVLDSPIRRWVMLAQYATQIYFIVAELHEEYIEYLLKGTRSRNPFDSTAYLTMRLLGPFSIYSAEEMRAFGFLVVTLTIVQHRDWKKSKED